MAMKDFDIKQFMLEKGERVGLIVAAVLMVGLMVMGAMSGFGLPPASETADWIKTNAQNVDNQIRSGPAIELPKLPDVAMIKQIDKEQVPYNPYLITTPSFFEPTLGDKKRHNPAILPPDELRVQLVRAQIQTYMISGNKTIALLIPLDPKAKPKLTPQEQYRLEMLKKNAAMMGGARPNMPIAGAPGVVAAGEGGAAPQEYRLEWVDIQKLKDARPASTIAPYRMLVVTGSFPYKRQLDSYLAALKPPGAEGGRGTLADLEKAGLLPQFHWWNVQRRTLDAAGKVQEEWRPLNLEQDMMPILTTMMGVAPDTPDLQRVIFPGLVMDRPLLARGAYPDVNLGLIAKSLRGLTEKIGTNEMRVLNPLQAKLQGQTNMFQVQQPKDEKAKPAPNPMDDKGKEKVAPDHCLVRFIDVTVKPGLTYEYQIQIKAANPNFGKKEEVAFPSLADARELTSVWSEPVRFTMPREQFVYAHEVDPASPVVKKNPSLRDAPWVQIHKWIESATPNADQARTTVPVGDWVIGEVPVRSGDYIGRLESIELPVWIPQKDGFAIGEPNTGPAPRPTVANPRPLATLSRGIPVNFTTEEVLVDWEGGTIRQRFQINDKQSRDTSEDANVEMLIVSPNGKLRVRNSRLDKSDTERSERQAEFTAFVKETKAKQGKPAAAAGNDPFKR